MASSEPVRILCAANATYAPSLCVVLVSLLINHARDRKIEIYVLATNIPQEDRQKIETSILKNRPDFDLTFLHWLTPSLDALRDIHLGEWAEVEIFARILAPRVLPGDFDRVIYLDSDTVVLSDLSPLHDSLREDCAVHAVRDEVGYVSEPNGVFNYMELGIPPKTPYFNSGVLLINLRYWREHHVADRVIEYLNLHQGLVTHWDQGGLNAILHDSWTEIDPAWNQMHCVLSPDLWPRIGLSSEAWLRAKNHPKIVHYTGRDKPWLSNKLPRYSYFFKYLNRTSYRNVYQGPHWEQIVGFRLNYLLWRAKIILLWKRSPRDIFRRLFRTGFDRRSS